MPLLIKDGQAVLFVHVPRTGGTSVVRWFLSAGWFCSGLDSAQIDDRNAANWYRRSSPQHLTAKGLVETYDLEKISGIFMFVRDPVDRLISEYHWRHSMTSNSEKPSLNSWWEVMENEFARDPFVLDNHIRPQADFFLPGLTAGSFEEDLSEDFLRTFLSSVGCNPHGLGFPQTNQGPDFRRAPKVNSKLRKRIQDFYQRDYNFFSDLMST